VVPAFVVVVFCPPAACGWGRCTDECVNKGQEKKERKSKKYPSSRMQQQQQQQQRQMQQNKCFNKNIYVPLLCVSNRSI
jgi:transcription initiation factor TFIID subunit TAF12